MLHSILKHSLFFPGTIFPPKDFFFFRKKISALLKAQFFYIRNIFPPEDLGFRFFWDISKEGNRLERYFPGSFKSAVYNSFAQAFPTFYFLVSCISVIVQNKSFPFQGSNHKHLFYFNQKFLETSGLTLQPESRKKIILM